MNGQSEKNGLKTTEIGANHGIMESGPGGSTAAAALPGEQSPASRHRAGVGFSPLARRLRGTPAAGIGAGSPERFRQARSLRLATLKEIRGDPYGEVTPVC